MVGLKNGNVVYQRGPTHPMEYWEVVHKNAQEGMGAIGGASLYSSSYGDSMIAYNLITLGDLEQEKEIALINKVLGEGAVSNTTDVKEFIKHFNEILMGAKQFGYAVERLKDALGKQKENPTQYTLPPGVSSLYASKLLTALNEEGLDFYNSITPDSTVPFEQWKKELEDFRINRAIMKAFNRMINISKDERKKLFGGNTQDEEQYKVLTEAIRSFPKFNDYFIQLIRSKINFTKLYNLFENEGLKLQNKTHKGIAKAIGSSGKGGLGLANTKRAATIGGSVAEWLNTLINSFGEGVKAAVESGGSSAGMNLQGERTSIDTVQLFIFESSIDGEKGAREVMDILNEQTMKSRSLIDAAKQMEDFYNQHLKNLNDSFIIYENAKNYSMSSSFEKYFGFSGAHDRPIRLLPQFLSAINANVTGNVEDFVKLAYNTGDGAIFSGERGRVEEQIKKALMASAAHLLFDDWNTIGAYSGSGTQAIHVMRLEGVAIPLSSFLHAMGRAIQMTISSENFFRVSVNLPSAITYPFKVPVLKWGTGKEADRAVKDMIYKYWDDEAKKADKESTFSIDFLENFRSIIGSWIDF